MGNRKVAGFQQVNANIQAPAVFDVDASDSAAVGVLSGVAGLTVQELGDEAVHQTVLTLVDVPQSVVAATRFQGTKLYTFPKCRMNVLGITATLQQRTTSDVAATINSGVTGAVALGTTAAAATTLNSTAADLLASTAFASSTTVNVGGTAVGGLLAPTQLDGHTTAKDLFLNSAYVTAADVDANGTQAWSGTITITWTNLGTHP